MSARDQANPTPPPARGRRKFTVDALFTDHRPQAAGVRDLPEAKEIRIDRIIADPEQPRTWFDEEKLQELADSIQREGLLQPIGVRYDAERDVYIILHGERRFRAVSQLGHEYIAAIVREVPAERRLIQQLMENIVRDDLNAVDRAAALRALKSQLGDVPWDVVADHVGIRRSRLFQLLGTEKLPETAQHDLRAGRLNEKQSRALHGLSEPVQEALREAIVDQEIAATEAMRLSRSLREMPDLADVAAAREAIAGLLVPRQATVALPPGGRQLLELVGEAARGDDNARTALANTDDTAPFSRDRLEERIDALAATLARMPADLAVRDLETRTMLRALADTLAALLDPTR